jgi:hypothetical protein
MALRGVQSTRIGLRPTPSGRSSLTIGLSHHDDSYQPTGLTADAESNRGADALKRTLLTVRR